MAQKTEITLVDDLDGGAAHESIPFSIDGTEYVIDLSKVHAEELRETMQPFIDAARRIRKGVTRRSSDGHVSVTKREIAASNATIRAWAHSQPDIEIKDRGAIPTWVRKRFTDSHI